MLNKIDKFIENASDTKLFLVAVLLVLFAIGLSYLIVYI